jgi:hypothetical protein
MTGTQRHTLQQTSPSSAWVWFSFYYFGVGHKAGQSVPSASVTG